MVDDDDGDDDDALCLSASSRELDNVNASRPCGVPACFGCGRPVDTSTPHLSRLPSSAWEPSANKSPLLFHLNSQRNHENDDSQNTRSTAFG